MATEPRYGWNPRAGRYVNAQGQFVPESAVRGVLETALQYHARQARELALALRDRRTSISEFSVGMRQLIKDTQLYSAMLAVGGRAQMTPALNGLAGQRIAVQYQYLSSFTQQLRLGLPLDGRVLVRAELYALAAWGTWSVFQQVLQRQLGRTEYRNRLRPADHCAECLHLTTLQFQPIGVLVPIGERTCLTRCRCYFEYR